MSQRPKRLFILDRFGDRGRRARFAFVVGAMLTVAVPFALAALLFSGPATATIDCNYEQITLVTSPVLTSFSPGGPNTIYVGDTVSPPAGRGRHVAWPSPASMRSGCEVASSFPDQHG